MRTLGRSMVAGAGDVVVSVAFVTVALVAASCSSAMPPATSSAPGGPVAALPTASPGVSPTPAPPTDREALPSPDPNAPSIAHRDPAAPVRLPGSTHAVELVLVEAHVTVATGYVQTVWSVDWSVPAPVIRVREGDTIRAHVVNRPPREPVGHPPVNEYAHALAFDGSVGADAEQARPLEPAEETTFELRAGRPGVWLYHGSTKPLVENLANGLYGMLIVEPRGGLAPVDQELFLVQGEWYIGGVHPLNPPLPSLARATAPNAVPDFVVVNGVADQYIDRPIRVRTGARIRLFLLDAGPNLPTSFAIEGVPIRRILTRGPETAGTPAGDPVRLAPGQGAIVEFTLPRDGLYAFSTNAGMPGSPGARGLLEAASTR